MKPPSPRSSRRTFLRLAALSAPLCWLASAPGAAAAAPAVGKAAPMRAMWVYETEALLASPAAWAELLAFCAPRGITDVFFQVHYEGGVKGAPMELRDAARLAPFLRAAAKANVRVHALGGDPAHVLPENHDKVLARVDALAAFNQAAGQGARFAGMHLDIEPHAAPSWKSADDAEKCRLLTLLVEVNVKAAERLRARAPGALYGADIAFWLDKVNADGSPAYPVTFRGKAADATKHLLDHLDNVGLMSYRGAAEGPNGIVSIVSRAVTYADTAKGRAFVGVKMANIGPAMESFFGRTEEEMNAELRKVDEAYGARRGYAGLAFFMYSAYKAMPRAAK